MNLKNFARKFALRTTFVKISADLLTPIAVYLALRDRAAKSLIFEIRNEDASAGLDLSVIAINQIASFDHKKIKINRSLFEVSADIKLENLIENFKALFITENDSAKSIAQRLFGYISYQAIEQFEQIKLANHNQASFPLFEFALYEYVIVYEHLVNQIIIYHNSIDQLQVADFDQIIKALRQKKHLDLDFIVEDTVQNFDSKRLFQEKFNQAKKSIELGDVFQIVISQEYSFDYCGDDFKLFCALRQINPAAYQFYFDQGNFKIIGCSPETQLRIVDQQASLKPIAGTARKLSKDNDNCAVKNQLIIDPKENSEHVMLIDLARNDLNTCSENVAVVEYKKVKELSTLFHLVSKVSGRVTDRSSALKLIRKTFPAGTLSGAPKYKALELIDQLEESPRNLYGGCIGYIQIFSDSDIEINLAIIIRSFISYAHQIHMRAGAGIVLDSKLDSEFSEIKNKLHALNLALDFAQSNQEKYV